MKKFMFTLITLLTLTTSAQAMSYYAAREQALFLTDKMAYELNLTPEQYEAAYEVNLDYLMSVATIDDLYGPYWLRRNTDLQFILFDWQYRLYLDALYFFRPLYWNAGAWHFRIYAHYPHRTLYYFDRPRGWNTYRGMHGARHHAEGSWYQTRTFNQQSGGGMRDNWNGQTRTFVNNHQRSGHESSTRTTVRSFSNGSSNSSSTRSFGNGSSNTAPSRSFSNGNSSSTRSFGNGSSNTSPSRSFSNGNSSSTRSFGNGNNAGASRSFGGGSGSTPSVRSNAGGSTSGSHSSGGGVSRSFGNH